MGIVSEQVPTLTLLYLLHCFQYPWERLSCCSRSFWLLKPSSTLLVQPNTAVLQLWQVVLCLAAPRVSCFRSPFPAVNISNNQNTHSKAHHVHTLMLGKKWGTYNFPSGIIRKSVCFMKQEVVRRLTGDCWLIPTVVGSACMHCCTINAALNYVSGSNDHLYSPPRGLMISKKIEPSQMAQQPFFPTWSVCAFQNRYTISAKLARFQTQHATVAVTTGPSNSPSWLPYLNAISSRSISPSFFTTCLNFTIVASKSGPRESPLSITYTSWSFLSPPFPAPLQFPTNPWHVFWEASAFPPLFPCPLWVSGEPNWLVPMQCALSSAKTGIAFRGVILRWCSNRTGGCAGLVTTGEGGWIGGGAKKQYIFVDAL